MSCVVITGISRGIGKATAEKFLAMGWIVIGSSQSGNVSLEHEHLKSTQLDVTSESSIECFNEFVLANTPEINVLINNAAILIDEGQDLTMDILRRTVDVNLLGMVQLTEKLLPSVSQNGHIINLTSGLGSIERTSNAYYPAYRISKAAVNMYTRVLAARLTDRNIRVSSIDPGWVKTKMGGANATRNPSEPAEEIYELATSKADTGYYWHKGEKQTW